MNNNIPLLEETISTNEFPILESLSKLKSGIYKIIIPEGSNDALMKHASGDLAGLKTTTIVDSGKIVGTAGLEEINVSAEVSQLLKRLTNYSVLAGRINSLSNNLNALLNFQHDQYKATIRNMLSMFRDISRKMPAILNDDNYSHLVSLSFPVLKKDAGEFFEAQKANFFSRHQQNNSYNNIESYINSLDELKKQPVFYAFEILLTIEIFEIMIAGKNNNGYISAVRETLMERIQPIINVLETQHSNIKSEIDKFVYNRENQQLTISEHRNREAYEKKLYCTLDEQYSLALENKFKVYEYLDESLNVQNLREVFFKFQKIEANQLQ